MALFEVEGQKISDYEFVIQGKARALVWVEYEVKNHKVVVTHKSVSLDPWDEEHNCLAKRSEDWHYYAKTPSAAKAMVDKWARKYAPELLGLNHYDTEYWQTHFENRINEAQYVEDKAYFKERVEAFKADLKKIMKKHGIGIEGYVSSGDWSDCSGSVDLYDMTRPSHTAEFEETILDLEDREVVNLENMLES